MIKNINYGLSQGLKKGAIALVIMTAFISGCTNNNEQATTEDTTASPEVAQTQPTEPAERAEQGNVQIEDLTGNVDEYIGQEVSVRGDVQTQEAMGESAFFLQNDQWFGGEEVLVINASGEPFVVPGDEPAAPLVQVTGEVRQLVRADLEREYNLVLDPNVYAEYEERPVIVAQSIALAPDPEEISAAPEAYYNKDIAVTGEILEQVAPNTYTIQQEQIVGGIPLLVVNMNPEIPLETNEEVVITGQLRQYVAADFERDYNLTWDADVQREIEAEYADKPVLVADEVYPSAK
ncbi:conserved hypothetical protein [Gloeothece citriformis PCC 7424]|uniref:Uncharacterized protein n=1 Tax=Gloeothece citriformis (strain PCC 7424) TaxID=65393 RepID=B7K7I7_GLOC7|nr:hypothetical protein [Gloeothece citriformis]ACK69755.1 conserved hypothetical protein [Gloeothece citriformis PCC 7424]